MAAPSPGSGRMPLALKRSSSQSPNSPRVDLLQAHDRPGLVERPLGAHHALHERRLRAGKHVADGTLVLHGGTQCVFHVAAVEGLHRLELVERDGHLLLADGRNPARQREDLGRQPRGVAGRANGGKGEAEAGIPGSSGVEAHFRPHALQQVGGPPAQPAHRRVGSNQRPRVRLEKPHIGARSRHRDLHRQHTLAAEGPQHVTHERRLAVAARRDQEDLLARAEVAAQPVAFDVTVREGVGGDNLAVDERIGACRHYGIIRNGYVD